MDQGEALIHSAGGQDTLKEITTVLSEGLVSNAPCWSDQLPFELLAEIFRWRTFYCLVECQNRHHDPQHMEAPVVLTKVCPRWAEIVYSTPSLWTRICSNSYVRKNDYYLTKSNDLPLDIVLHHSYMFRSPYFRTDIFPCSHKFRSLTIHNPIEVLPMMGVLLHLPVPLLEEFSIDVGQSGWHPPPQTVIFFDDCAPRLRKLTLDPYLSITISWDSSLLRNLTHLAISDVLPSAKEGDDWSPKYHNLFLAVPLIQEVEIFCFRRSGLLDSRTTPRESPFNNGLEKIALPDLTSVKLQGLPLSIVFTILSFIAIPLTSSITVSASGCSWSSVFPHDQLSADGSLLSLVTSLPTRLSIQPHLWKSSSPMVFVNDSKTPSTKGKNWVFVLGLKGQILYPFIDTLLPVTRDSSPLKLLSLEGEIFFRKQLSAARLHLFDRVEVLSLKAFCQKTKITRSEFRIAGFLCCLCTPRTSAIPSSQNEWAFPKLKKLQLRDMILPASTLELFIKTRCRIDSDARAPAPLEALSITKCCLDVGLSDGAAVISAFNLVGNRLGWEELVHGKCDCPTTPPLNGTGCLNSARDQVIY